MCANNTNIMVCKRVGKEIYQLFLLTSMGTHMMNLKILLQKFKKTEPMKLFARAGKQKEIQNLKYDKIHALRNELMYDIL